MEVFTTMSDEATALQTIMDANDFTPQSEKLAQSIKNAIPTDVKNSIKKILGR
jgi:hypothetical protein